MPALTYKYIPSDVYDPTTNTYSAKDPQREENLFVEEYYCSTDTRIFIEDAEQTEIAYINYSLQEQLKPLYGYASNTFDDVAIGNRIITGMIKVSIKNPNAQATIDEVIAEGSGETNAEDYNEEQEELKKAVEWIDNLNGSNKDNTNIETPSSDKKSPMTSGDLFTSPDTSGDYNTTNPDVTNTSAGEYLDFIHKLYELGYDVTTKSTFAEITSAVTAYQNDHSGRLSEITGTLNSETKSLILKDYTDKLNNNYEQAVVREGTAIHYEPNYDSSNEIIEANTKCSIIYDNLKDGWVYIELASGKCGYVKKELLY